MVEEAEKYAKEDKEKKLLSRLDDISEKDDEIEMMMEENSRLTEQLNNYENKTKTALDQLDEVLGQLTDI